MGASCASVRLGGRDVRPALRWGRVQEREHDVADQVGPGKSEEMGGAASVIGRCLSPNCRLIFCAAFLPFGVSVAWAASSERSAGPAI
jgi:hypothetical protein